MARSSLRIVHMSGYREIWSIPGARTVLVLGLLCRLPMFGAMVLLTVHVVERIDPRYSAAGLIVMAATVAQGISGPWRGRLLDRQGLRRTLLPSLIIVPLCWIVAPWSSYWILLALVIIAGLFAVPVFALLRQALLGAVEVRQRKQALALDSVITEISFMAGPALAIWVATLWGTAWTLLTFQLMSVAAAGVLFAANPPLRHKAGVAAPPTTGTRWVSPAALGILGLTMATTIALTATDLTVVAGLRALDQATSIGWVLAIWGFGSAVGGLLFGAIQRPIGAWVVVAALGATTMPVAFANSDWSMAALLLIAGFFCAPAITATSEALSRVVPESSRGEAFGWHGTALTTGSALAAPLVGIAIDHQGWPAGYVVGGGVTLVLAVAGALALRARVRRDNTPDPVPVEAVPRAGNPSA